MSRESDNGRSITRRLLAASAFQKWIDNPVFSGTEDLTDVTYGGRFYESLRRNTTRNADQGEIRGLEVSYQQQFSFLTWPAAGFGAAANAALMDSELTSFTREDVLPAPIQARVVFRLTDDSLMALGGGPESDVYAAARSTVDLKAAYQLLQHVFLFIEGQNRTGEDRRIFQARAGQLYLDEGFGAVDRMGVNWRL